MGKGNTDEVKEVEILNVESSVYLKCRSFIAMTEKQMKEYIEKLGYKVKLVKKTLKRSHCFVDVGNVEDAGKLVKALNQKKYQKSVVVASKVNKSNPTQNKNDAKTGKDLTILDRLLCMRGISKFVSKKTVTDLFKGVESVLLPSQKGNSLRDAIVVFHKAAEVNAAIKEYQGCELGGLKLNLERLMSVPAEASDVSDEPKKEKKNKKEEKVDVKATKDEKKNKRKAEDMDDDSDDDVEDMEGDDDGDSDDDDEIVGVEDMTSDVDDDDEEEEEEEEVAKPPKKKKQKKN